ncbi:MAG TPA: aspartyl protease family protein [Rhizomicrobium sp.]|jgi:predicted aspartyl protease|nr:aspartyl protease family protein [Rhizomicrobium sp.]
MKSFTMLGLLAASVSYSTLAFAAPSADEVLSTNKAATAPNWDSKAALKVSYDYAGQGLTGKVESIEDLKDGRWTDSVNLGPVTMANGFDGAHAWAKDPSGTVTVQDGGDQRQLAVNEGYRRANLWWRPGHGGAQIVSDGEKTQGGATFDVLTVTPKGGKNFDAWFDSKTHLLVRIVEAQGPQTFTTTLSGFKTIDGVMLPDNTLITNGDPKYDQHATATNATFLSTQPASAYAAPRVTVADFAIAGGHQTSFPFQLINNHIYAQVSVNGKPFTFIFDTGGTNLMTPATAKTLGLQTQGQMQANGAGSGHMDAGMTKVSSIQLGQATIKDQVFVVIPLDQMSSIEGIPMTGMIGFETFRRFVTRVDYGTDTLTLIDPKSFDSKDAGTPIPIVFDGNTIEVAATYNGVKGNFTVDTGSRASLTLNRPFAAANGIGAGKGIDAVTGWGIGGPSRSIALRGSALQLGPYTIAGPVVEVSTDKGGAFADASQSGNIGAGILKRYVLTLDYGHSVMYVKPVAGPVADLDTFDRAGMWINQTDDGFAVVDVTKGAPAEAAGIKTGDTIVAVDGKPATAIALTQIRSRLRDEAPGTVETFTVKTGSATRDVRVTLRDLI